MHNIAESGEDARIKGVRFCVVAEAFCKVTYLTRVDNGECNLGFMQQSDEQRFLAASRLHDNDRLTGFLEGCDITLAIAQTCVSRLDAMPQTGWKGPSSIATKR